MPMYPSHATRLRNETLWLDRADAAEIRRRDFEQALMEKTAGEYDEAAMRELGKKVRPGDILSWEVPSADAYREGALSGLSADAISGSIRATTRSPISHTALIHSVDPETGIPNIVHNYEGNKGAKLESLRRYADTNVMHVARPNISENQAREAVDRAMAAVERQVKYPKRDLALMRRGEAAKRVGLDGVASQFNRIGEAIARATGGKRHCDPATGVCSSFVSHALAPAFGSQEAAQRALGGTGGGRLGITPADIFNASRDPSNTAIHEITSYRPKNQETSRVGGLLHSALDRLKKGR